MMQAEELILQRANDCELFVYDDDVGQTEWVTDHDVVYLRIACYSLQRYAGLSSAG